MQHKADFSFDYRPTGEIGISVSLPDYSQEPFFSAIVTPSKLLPSFPLKTSWIPISLDLLQPPLPAVDQYAVSTEEWQKTPFSIHQPNGQVAYIKPSSSRSGGSYANGIDFPDVKPFAAGVYCKDAVVDFKVPFTPQVVALPSSSRVDTHKRD